MPSNPPKHMPLGKIESSEDAISLLSFGVSCMCTGYNVQDYQSCRLDVKSAQITTLHR